MAFEQRQIGKTGVKVTTLGLGGATLAGNMAHNTDEDGRILVLAAYDEGVRYFDTAPFYGYGRSERLMGDGLRKQADWVLSTKVGRRLRPNHKPRDPADLWQNPLPFEPYFDYSYDGVMRSYEDSLQRLGLNHIDILYIHDVDAWSHGAEYQPGMFRIAMQGAYKALEKLRASGDVKAIGLGVNQSEPISSALDHGDWDVFLLAGRYTLLEQDPLETLFPSLEKHGASVIIGGPFNSGVLVGRETWNYATAPEPVMKKVKAIAAVCDAHKVPLAVAALHFPLAHPLVASTIPGPRSPAEFNEIVAWWNTPVPPALWRDLKTEKLIDAAAPVPT